MEWMGSAAAWSDARPSGSTACVNCHSCVSALPGAGWDSTSLLTPTAVSSGQAVVHTAGAVP